MADDCSVPSRCRGSPFLSLQKFAMLSLGCGICPSAQAGLSLSQWLCLAAPGVLAGSSVPVLSTAAGAAAPAKEPNRQSWGRKGQSRRHGSSRLLRSQALGLCSIKALAISGWGWFREQVGLGHGWKSAGSWDQDWKRRQGIGVGGSSRTDRPPASCPNLHYPDIEDFLLSLSSVTTFASCPCADKRSWLCPASWAAAALVYHPLQRSNHWAETSICWMTSGKPSVLKELISYTCIGDGLLLHLCGLLQA